MHNASLNDTDVSGVYVGSEAVVLDENSTLFDPNITHVNENEWQFGYVSSDLKNGANYIGLYRAPNMAKYLMVMCMANCYLVKCLVLKC